MSYRGTRDDIRLERQVADLAEQLRALRQEVMGMAGQIAELTLRVFELENP